LEDFYLDILEENNDAKKKLKMIKFHEKIQIKIAIQ
jgi:hypothetical protein